MPRVVAIIQARTASARLPKKVLADIAGHPMLYHVINRVQRARRVDLVVVATTTDPSDDAIEALCKEMGVRCFRGHPTDVLERYYQAANRYGADIIVRVTGDCPLWDCVMADRLLERFLSGDYDYASNVFPIASFPDGLDTEVLSYECLERLYNEARRPVYREHVTAYIHDNPRRFRIFTVESDVDLSHYRWTVDEACDLEFVRAIYAARKRSFGIQDVLEVLRQHPEITRLNAGIGRNEGYAESVRRERDGR